MLRYHWADENNEYYYQPVWYEMQFGVSECRRKMQWILEEHNAEEGLKCILEEQNAEEEADENNEYY